MFAALAVDEETEAAVEEDDAEALIEGSGDATGRRGVKEVAAAGRGTTLPGVG
jgi:hypothetical protein